MNLTVYSNDYEIDSSPGMNGKVFLENNKDGIEFKSVQDAFDYVEANGVCLKSIIFMYKKENIQMFKKLKLEVSDF